VREGDRGLAHASRLGVATDNFRACVRPVHDRVQAFGCG
jgi:hypothetical protein